jgi:hypothetical protein
VWEGEWKLSGIFKNKVHKYTSVDSRFVKLTNTMVIEKSRAWPVMQGLSSLFFKKNDIALAFWAFWA